MPLHGDEQGIKWGKKEGEVKMEKEIDYRAGIHRMLDKIQDGNKLKAIYKFICYCYARA